MATKTKATKKSIKMMKKVFLIGSLITVKIIWTITYDKTSTRRISHRLGELMADSNCMMRME